MDGEGVRRSLVSSPVISGEFLCGWDSILDYLEHQRRQVCFSFPIVIHAFTWSLRVDRSSKQEPSEDDSRAGIRIDCTGLLAR